MGSLGDDLKHRLGARKARAKPTLLSSNGVMVNRGRCREGEMGRLACMICDPAADMPDAEFHHNCYVLVVVSVWSTNTSDVLCSHHKTVRGLHAHPTVSSRAIYYRYLRTYIWYIRALNIANIVFLGTCFFCCGEF